MMPLVHLRTIAFRIAITGMLIALTTAIGTPASAPGPDGQASIQTSRVACVNIPMSSALIVPTDCVALPQGVIAAGKSPSSGHSLVAVLTDQQRNLLDFGTAGSLEVKLGSAQVACVVDGGGRTTGIDLASAVVTKAAVDACPSSNHLELVSASVKSALQPDTARSHAMGIAPATASNGPAASYSYYVASSFVSECPGNATNSCHLWQMGADASVPTTGSLNIIDFGAPCDVNGIPGVQTFFQAVCYPNSTISNMLREWINGYETTHSSQTPPSIIAAGVSNSVNGIPGDYPQSNPTEMHIIGTAFAQQVVNPAQSEVANLPARLTVWGAIDAEEASNTNSWMGPTPTKAFVDSFGVATGHGSGSYSCVPNGSGMSTPGMLADFGDAVYMEPNFDGSYPGGWGPSGGWTQADIYHVAFGAPVACAVPEIYYDINAAEWASLSDWASKNGLQRITFTAAMSENGIGGTETAAQSWSSLSGWTGQSVPFLTNIAWSITLAPAVLQTLPGTESTASFPVTWQTASGIPLAGYRLFALDVTGQSRWILWSNNTTSNSATFIGTPGHTYDFYIETYGNGFDNGGPSVVEATTTIASGASPVAQTGYQIPPPVYGLARDYYPGVAHWVSSKIVDPWMVDGPGYQETALGALSMVTGPQMQPLYSCLAGSTHFISLAGNCEGQTSWGIDGYDSTVPTARYSVQIWRCRTPSNDHFVSHLSNCEGQVSEGSLGYTSNGLPFGRYVGSNDHWSTSGQALYTYSLEGVLGWVTALPGPGMHPLYECVMSGTHFTSGAANCEGQGYAGMMGWASNSPVAGGVILYRCFTGRNHFDSTSSNCEGGGSSEGVLGYLWSTDPS